MKRMHCTKSDLKLVSNSNIYELCYKNYVLEEAIICTNKTYIEITLAQIIFNNQHHNLLFLYFFSASKRR